MEVLQVGAEDSNAYDRYAVATCLYAILLELKTATRTTDMLLLLVYAILLLKS